MKIGYIGLGNMGAIIAKSIDQLDLDNLTHLFSDHNLDKARHLASDINHSVVIANNKQIASESQFLIIGVKPQQVVGLLTSLKDFISPDTHVISMAAGISIKQLTTVLGPDQPLIRMMPNTPSQVGQGVILYSGSLAAQTQVFEGLMLKAGMTIKLAEEKIDAATALAGCGPAFVYTMIDSMVEVGVALGIDRPSALMMTSQVFLGAAQMINHTGNHPMVLKDQVTSPGGSTIAGFLAMEKAGLRSAIHTGIEAAYEKNKALGKEKKEG